MILVLLKTAGEAEIFVRELRDVWQVRMIGSVPSEVTTEDETYKIIPNFNSREQIRGFRVEGIILGKGIDYNEHRDQLRRCLFDSKTGKEQGLVTRLEW